MHCIVSMVREPASHLARLAGLVAVSVVDEDA